MSYALIYHLFNDPAYRCACRHSLTMQQRRSYRRRLRRQRRPRP